jgi:hypothetical protein
VPDGGSLNREQRRRIKQLERETRGGVGGRRLLAIRIVPIEALLDPDIGSAPLEAFVDFIDAIAGGRSRRCGDCDLAFTVENEPPAAVVLISGAARPSVALASALCRGCCDRDMRGAGVRAVRRACGDDFDVLDPARFGRGGRA